MRYAIKVHLRDFIAILALVLIAVVVGGYIVGKQRITVPGWVPVVGHDFYKVRAEFQTGQSVTPGQGQTVRIAGVRVGDIIGVDLENGRAVIDMQIAREHLPRVYRDAKMLLRPKTGLNDMFIDMDKGTPEAGVLGEDEVLSASNTAPNVNPDEVWAILDADTRDYLRILIDSAGEGLDGNGENLRRTFAAFEPMHRNIAEITTEVSKRRKNLARLMHHLNLFFNELGRNDDLLAKWVDSSAAVFEAFASQEAGIRASLREFPTALSETRSALEKAEPFAEETGEALERLRAFARELGPSQRKQVPFAKATTPIVRDEIRPFIRAARPVVSDLRPAARDLRKGTPQLTRTFSVLNDFFNMFAYNPKGAEGPEVAGREEGFLFWFAWVNHTANSVLASTDAHGPIRRILLLANCRVISDAVASQPALSFLYNFESILTNPEACGGDTPEGPGGGS